MKKLILLLAIILFLGCQKEDIPTLKSLIGFELIGKSVPEATEIINSYGVTANTLITFSNDVYRKFGNDTIYILINEVSEISYAYINYKYGFTIKIDAILDVINSNQSFKYVSDNKYIYKEAYQLEIITNNENIYLTTVDFTVIVNN